MDNKEKKVGIVRYDAEHKEEWDRFVTDSRNGTFLLIRDYMDYHSDRFTDHSLLFYKGGHLIAMLPAHISNNTLCSHKGLTYGGLILGNEATAGVVMEIFDSLCEYLKSNSIANKILYRPIPYIYHRYPCEEDLYALFRHSATLVERKISSVVSQKTPLPFHGRRKITTACKNRMRITEDNNFTAFWEVLDKRLKERYETKPVHTLEEIKLLHSRFPENIKLARVTDNDGNTLAGVVMYLTEKVVHAQYTATSDEGRRIGALDYLYEYLLRTKFPNIEYFDFGTSVENGGLVLNQGLIGQKEGFGGRAVVYDTYTIEIKAEHD